MYKRQEDTRPWVARLRPRRQRADLDVAEAQRRQPGYDPRVLVEAGGHAQRVRKVQWANLYR